MAEKRPTKKAPAKAGEVKQTPEGEDDALLQRARRHHLDFVPTKSLSVDAQWAEVQSWHEYLEENAGSDRPTVNSWNAQWAALQGATELSDGEAGRGAGLRKTAENPVVALFYFIQMGFYPPPELLLALHDAWERYEAASGTVTLEEAFFGPTRKGLGNYAARRASRFRRTWMQWEFARMLRAGMSRNEIAEELSNRMGGKPDADSILRSLRGFTGPKVAAEK